MKVKVKAKAQWSQFHRRTVDTAASWAIDELGLNGLNITLKLSGESDEQGGAMVTLFRGNKMSFMVWINQCWSIKYMVECVFHELVHVQQVMQERFPCEDDLICSNTDSKDYWNAPWEVEARRVAKKLKKRYFKMVK